MKPIRPNKRRKVASSTAMNDQDWKPCETCAKKVGAAVLCPGCSHNRLLIDRLRTKIQQLGTVPRSEHTRVVLESYSTMLDALDRAAAAVETAQEAAEECQVVIGETSGLSDLVWSVDKTMRPAQRLQTLKKQIGEHREQLEYEVGQWRGLADWARSDED